MAIEISILTAILILLVMEAILFFGTWIWFNFIDKKEEKENEPKDIQSETDEAPNRDIDE